MKQVMQKLNDYITSYTMMQDVLLKMNQKIIQYFNNFLGILKRPEIM